MQDENSTELTLITYPFIRHSKGNIKKLILNEQKTEIDSYMVKTSANSKQKTPPLQPNLHSLRLTEKN